MSTPRTNQTPDPSAAQQSSFVDFSFLRPAFAISVGATLFSVGTRLVVPGQPAATFFYYGLAATHSLCYIGPCFLAIQRVKPLFTRGWTTCRDEFASAPPSFTDPARIQKYKNAQFVFELFSRASLVLLTTGFACAHLVSMVFMIGIVDTQSGPGGGDLIALFINLLAISGLAYGYYEALKSYLTVWGISFFALKAYQGSLS